MSVRICLEHILVTRFKKYFRYFTRTTYGRHFGIFAPLLFFEYANATEHNIMVLYDVTVVFLNLNVHHSNAADDTKLQTRLRFYEYSTFTDDCY